MNTETIHKLPLDQIEISAHNTRHPKPAEVTELTQSIKQFGQTTPAIARPRPNGHKPRYELAAGARRFVAARAAGLSTLDVIVREMTDDVLEETILVENLQREDPDPRAEVKLLDRLVKRGMNASTISAHLGKPEHWVLRRLRLLKVIPEIRKQWESGREGFARYSVDMMELIGSLETTTQQSLLTRDGNWWLRQVNSRAELQKELEKHIFCNLATAPFDLNDPKFFAKDCGPGCASDSSKQGALFDMSNKDARCLNCSCFNSRLGKWREFKLKELRKKHGIKKDLPLLMPGDGYGSTERIQIGNQAYNVARPDYSQKIVYEEPKKGGGQMVHVTNKQGTTFKIGWLVKGRESSGQRSTSSQPKLSATERRQKGHDLLQSRRWDIVRRDLIQRVLKSEAKDVTEDLVDLVVVFGTCQYNNPERGERKNHNSNWDYLDQRKKKGYRVERLCEDEINYGVHDCIRGGGMYEIDEKTFKDRKDAIWHILKPVIVNQLLGAYRVLNIVEENIAYDIDRVGQLIAFDTKKAKLEADLTIPPPKSWGKVDVHTLEPLTAKDALKSLRKKVKKS